MFYRGYILLLHYAGCISGLPYRALHVRSHCHAHCVAIAFNETQSWLRDSLGDAIDATWSGDWFTVAP